MAINIKSIFSYSPQEDLTDLEFMDEVAAAMRNRGSRWAYRLSYLLLVIFVSFFVWSCFSTRNEVTKGEGQVIPSMGIQPIQSPEGGVIRNIFVREDQEVAAGEILVEMANVDIVTGYQDLLNRQAEYRLGLKRLAAESAGVVPEFTLEEQTVFPDVVQDQMRLYTTRKEKFEGEGREIEATLEQKLRAVDEAQLQKKLAEDSLILLRQQEQQVAPLVRRKLYPEIDFLNLKQRIATQQGELKTLAEAIANTMSEVRTEEVRLENRQNQWESLLAEESNEYRRQLDSVEEKLKAGDHAVKGNDLRAPMAGIIKQVLLKPGNVAQRAETILELVPTEDVLEVEARFRPADRSFLEVGQKATVSVTAYDASVYGTLNAMLTSISPDTIEDNKGNAWYEVRLRTEGSKLVYEGQDLEIKAGMTVSADVISGEKTVFDYLMKPIIKSTGKNAATIRTVSPNAIEGETPAEDTKVSPVEAPSATSANRPALNYSRAATDVPSATPVTSALSTNTALNGGSVQAPNSSPFGLPRISPDSIPRSRVTALDAAPGMGGER